MDPISGVTSVQGTEKRASIADNVNQNLNALTGDAKKDVGPKTNLIKFFKSIKSGFEELGLKIHAGLAKLLDITKKTDDVASSKLSHFKTDRKGISQHRAVVLNAKVSPEQLLAKVPEMDPDKAKLIVTNDLRENVYFEFKYKEGEHETYAIAFKNNKQEGVPFFGTYDLTKERDLQTVKEIKRENSPSFPKEVELALAKAGIPVYKGKLDIGTLKEKLPANHFTVRESQNVPGALSIEGNVNGIVMDQRLDPKNITGMIDYLKKNNMTSFNPKV